MTELSVDVATHKERAEEADGAKRNAISTKDLEVKSLIAAKEESTAEQIRLVRLHCQQQIDEERRHGEKQARLLEDAETKLAATFEASGMKALKSASEEFLKLAVAKFETTQEQADGQLKARHKAIEELLKPMQTCLSSLEEQCDEMEQKRLSAYDAVSGQIERLMQETGHLSNALRRPTARGSWGELTLRTVAENAGLVAGQDFELQHSSEGEDGTLRADMVVRLPNKRAIVVDCKTPLDSYREAVNCEDADLKQTHLANHARLVRSHIAQLGSKGYHSQYEGVDYVIMFLPAESIYQAAMETDPTLVEYAMKNHVLLANPMTLIGLLRAVAHVLDQERAHRDAEAIRVVGKNLYEGIQSYAGHVGQLGKLLTKSVDTYNRSLGSLERMVLSRARTLRSKGAVELPDIAEVTVLPVAFRSPELSALPPDFPILDEPEQDPEEAA